MAVEQAEEHIDEYAYNAVKIPKRGERNLLTAALKCGCRACVGAYVAMVEFLVQDERVAERIVEHHGVKQRRGR